ncbi:coiled-coil domain-containing protein 13 isoform X3 [Apus apus]|uniref:coiled-coil domain-containing protein 13 isoform X3 n=1 Tax=Apus apus TaxID=8895 RepID=UPI0021F84182|nr:coiled-coil domain-containing protein 13 isoform X3 [Apus apus]
MESDIKESEHFKSQFKAYQEQQQKRLQNLMEKKKEKQNSLKGDNGNTKEVFRIPDDLNLLETGQPVNEDDSKRLFEAEKEQLQDQLREVRDENCRLYKLVTDKDFEIKQLQKKIQEDRLALSGASGLAGDVVATKIVELAKKNREITAEAEREKAKVKQLSNKVKELEKELQTAVGKIQSLGGCDAGIKQSALKMTEGNLAESPEVKALQEKLTTANMKVLDYRNQLQSAKQELKMTQKLLANEVGEDVNIQSLLINSGGWRGRAQQILVLQSKVRELESQLGQNKTRTSLGEIAEELLVLTDPRKLSAQEKNLLKIRSLEKEKKEALEKKSAHQGDSSGPADPPPPKHSEGFTLASGSNQVGRIESARTVSKMGHTLVESAATKPSLLSANITPGRLPGSDSPDLQVLQTQITEHRALCQAAEVERDRLLQLVTVLQKRVEEGNHEVLEAEKRLQEERRHRVVLEQQLEKLQLDPGRNRGAQKPPLRSKAGQSAHHSKLTRNVSDRKELPAAQLSKLPLESQIEELSTRLAIQLDENEALKAALETTVRKKEEDFKLYQDTMDQVKDIFLQAIRQQKQEKT